MASLADQLLSLLGPGRVSTTAADIATHSTDKWFASNPPEVVVHAQNVDDVSKTLCFANEHQIPVTPQGARVGYVGGCVPSRGGIALSLAKMNRIIEIKTEDGVAVVEPGVITGHLQAAVRKLGFADDARRMMAGAVDAVIQEVAPRLRIAGQQAPDRLMQAVTPAGEQSAHE